MLDHMISDDRIVPNSRMNVEIEHIDPNIERIHQFLPATTQQLIDEIKNLLDQNKSNQITIIG